MPEPQQNTQDPFAGISDLFETGDNREANRAYARSEATRRNLDPDLVDNIFTRESRYNRRAVGPLTKYGRAQGIGQDIPPTARQYGIKDPFDAKQNIDGNLNYLEHLTTLFKGDPRKIAAGYFSGEGRAEAALANPKDNPKTAAYVKGTAGEASGPFATFADLLEPAEPAKSTAPITPVGTVPAELGQFPPASPLGFNIAPAQPQTTSAPVSIATLKQQRKELEDLGRQIETKRDALTKQRLGVDIQGMRQVQSPVDIPGYKEGFDQAHADTLGLNALVGQHNQKLQAFNTAVEQYNATLPKGAQREASVSPKVPMAERVTAEAVNQPTGVEINLADHLKAGKPPEPAEVGKLSYQGLGFSDEEAADFARAVLSKSHVSPEEVASVFYRPSDEGSTRVLLDRASQDTMGRVILPDLESHASDAKRVWLQQYRINKAKGQSVADRAADIARVAEIPAGQREAAALELSKKYPDLTAEEQKQLGAGPLPMQGAILTDLSSIIRGAGEGFAAPTVKGVGRLFGSRVTEDFGKYIDETAKQRENLYGRKGAIGEAERTVGAIAPALATGTIGAMVGLGMLGSYGEHKPASQIALQGALTYLGLKGAAKMLAYVKAPNLFRGLQAFSDEELKAVSDAVENGTMKPANAAAAIELERARRISEAGKFFSADKAPVGLRGPDLEFLQSQIAAGRITEQQAGRIAQKTVAEQTRLGAEVPTLKEGEAISPVLEKLIGGAFLVGIPTMVETAGGNPPSPQSVLHNGIIALLAEGSGLLKGKSEAAPERGKIEEVSREAIAAKPSEPLVSGKTDEVPLGTKATWHAPEGDIPVTVTGDLGVKSGRRFVSVAESKTGIPVDELAGAPIEVKPTIPAAEKPAVATPPSGMEAIADLLEPSPGTTPATATKGETNARKEGSLHAKTGPPSETRGAVRGETGSAAKTSEVDRVRDSTKEVKGQVVATGAETPAASARKIAHERFGEVSVADNQDGVEAGHLRVTDSAGDEHVIQNPRTTGNRGAAFVRAASEIPKVEAGRKEPQVLYHGSGEKNIQSFSRTGDIGYHFGSKETAQQRGSMLGRKSDEWHVRSYSVDVANPVRLEYDPAEWGARELGKSLPDDIQERVARKLKIDYERDDDYTYHWTDELREGQNGQEQLRTALKELGYDGIEYENANEGGGKSLVAFDSNQIQPIKPTEPIPTAKPFPSVSKPVANAFSEALSARLAGKRESAAEQFKQRIRESRGGPRLYQEKGSQQIGIFGKNGKLIGTASLSESADPREWVDKNYGKSYDFGPLTMEQQKQIGTGKQAAPTVLDDARDDLARHLMLVRPQDAGSYHGDSFEAVTQFLRNTEKNLKTKEALAMIHDYIQRARFPQYTKRAEDALEFYEAARKKLFQRDTPQSYEDVNLPDDIKRPLFEIAQSFMAEGHTDYSKLVANFEKLLGGDFEYVVDQLPAIVSHAENLQRLRTAPSDKIDLAPGEAKDKAAAIGKASRVVTPRGIEARTRFALFESDQPITSHDIELRPNPHFPEGVQNRDRAKVSSEDDLQQKIKRFEPEYLGKSIEAGRGAPIIGPDMAVESGNGRVIMLRRIYRDHPEQAAKYKTWLKDNADKFGMTVAQVDGLKQPILAQIRATQLSPAERVQFAEQANENTQLKLSPVEVARGDARKVSAGLIAQFKPGADGDILAVSNREFVKGFLDQVVGPSRGDLLTSEGSLNQIGVDRVRNAIFARAYADTDAGISALEKLAEETDVNTKRVINAMVTVAPRFVELKQMVTGGGRYALDLSPDLAEAARHLSLVRESGITVDEFLRQGQLFGENISRVQKKLLWALNENARSSTKLSQILTNYLDAVDAIGDPRQQSFFNQNVPTKEEILEAAVRRIQDADQSNIAKAAEEAIGGARQDLFTERPGAASGTQATPGNSSKGAVATPQKAAAKPVTPTDRQSFKRALIDQWGYSEEVAHRTSEVMEGLAQSYVYDLKATDSKIDAGKAKRAFYEAVRVGSPGEGGARRARSLAQAKLTKKWSIHSTDSEEIYDVYNAKDKVVFSGPEREADRYIEEEWRPPKAVAVRLPPPVKENPAAVNAFVKAKQYFGTTSDITEAGYILPDGTMLDFTGTHQVGPSQRGQWLRGQRSVDHREIQDIVSKSGTQAMYQFVEYGAVRTHKTSGGELMIAFSKPLTESQMLVLSRGAENGAIVEVWGKDGERRFSEESSQDRISAMRTIRAANATANGNTILKQDNLASTEFTQTGEAIIRAAQNPNESSAIHEIFHASLPILARLANQPNAPSNLKAAIGTILEHSGFENIPEYLRLHNAWVASAETKEEHDHYEAASEKGARTWEGFFREGKSPTKALQAAFDKFKEWLSRIYRRIRPDMEMSDNVRRAFDRILGGEREQAALKIKEADHWNFKRSSFASPETESRFRDIVRQAAVESGGEHKTPVSREQHLERVAALAPDLIKEVKSLRQIQIATSEIFTAAVQYAQTLTNQAQELRAQITPATLPHEQLEIEDRVAALEHDATEIMSHTIGVRSEFGRSLSRLTIQKTDQMSPEKVLAYGKSLAAQRGLDSNSRTWRTAAQKLVGLSNEVQSGQSEKKRIQKERKAVTDGTAKRAPREGWQKAMLGSLKIQANEASARLQELYGKKLYQEGSLTSEELDRVKTKFEALKKEAAGRPIRTVVDEYLRQGGLFGSELSPAQQGALMELANPTRRDALKVEQGALFETKATLESRAEQKGGGLLFQEHDIPSAAHDIATILAARVAEESQSKNGLPLNRILEEMRGAFPDIIGQYEEQIKATADSLLKDARREALVSAARDPEQALTARAELARDISDARRVVKLAATAAVKKKAQMDAAWEADSEKAQKEAARAWDKSNAEWRKASEAAETQLPKAEIQAQRVFERQQRAAVLEEAKRISEAAKLEEQTRLEGIADDAREELKRAREAAMEAVKSNATVARERKRAEVKAAVDSKKWNGPIIQAAGEARARSAQADYMPTVDDLAAIAADKTFQPGMTGAQLHREMGQYGKAYSKNVSKVRDAAAELKSKALKAAAQRTIETRAVGKAEGKTKPAEQAQAREDYAKWQQEELARLAAEEAWQNKRIQTGKRDLAREFAKLQKLPWWETALDIVSLPRSLITVIDQPHLRQGLPALFNHPKVWAESLVKTWGTWTEAEMDRKTDALEAKPLTDLALMSGLALNSIRSRRRPLSLLARQEEFQNRLAQKLKYPAISERQYTIGLDLIRSDVFDLWAEPLLQKFPPSLHPEIYSEIARIVNILNGVGDLGAATQYTPLLNRLILFATRFLASRFQLLGMLRAPLGDWAYRNQPWAVRRVAAIEAYSYLGKLTALFALANLLGLTSLDIDDDKFLKLLIPGTNQKWDVTGGLGGYIKTLLKLRRSVWRKATGQREFEGDSLGDILKDFGRSKLAPAASLVVDRYTGKTLTGEPFTWTDQAVKNVTPMIAKDIYDAIKIDGLKGLIMVPFGLQGGNVSTYRSRKMSDRTGSEAERYATGFLRENMGQLPETPADYQRRTLITELTAAKKAGKSTDKIERDLAKNGGPLSPKEEARLSERLNQTPLEHAFPHLHEDQKAEVLKVATEAEKQAVEPNYKRIEAAQAERVKAMKESPGFADKTPQEQKEALKAVLSDARADEKKAGSLSGGESEAEYELRTQKSVIEDRLRATLHDSATFKAFSKTEQEEANRQLGIALKRFTVPPGLSARERESNAAAALKTMKGLEEKGILDQAPRWILEAVRKKAA